MAKTVRRKPAKSKAPIVVVRTYSAGVHVGRVIERRTSKEIKLGGAVRVWRWKGANTLHELALHGASLTEFTRISEAVSEITLTEAIEVILCSAEGAENLLKSRWLS